MGIFIAILTILSPVVLWAMFQVSKYMSYGPAKDYITFVGWTFVWLMPVIGGVYLLCNSL